jgi:hypothetical protein
MSAPRFVARRARCEVCEKTGPLLACGIDDMPMLWFCPEHYREHIAEVHGR